MGVLARGQTRTANNARIKNPTLYLTLSSSHVKDHGKESITFSKRSTQKLHMKPTKHVLPTTFIIICINLFQIIVNIHTAIAQ